jgi:hypothetical protein
MVKTSKLIKICLSAGYLIYGVYGHFLDTNGISLPGLKTPSDPNVKKD